MGRTRGITHQHAPSGGVALYPLELYVVTASGFYHYNPHEHRLDLHSEGDLGLVLSRFLGAGLGSTPPSS